MTTIRPEDLVGSVLAGVAASWHQSEDVRGPGPVHVWLTVDGRGTYRFHTAGDGSLDIAAGDTNSRRTSLAPEDPGRSSFML